MPERKGRDACRQFDRNSRKNSGSPIEDEWRIIMRRVLSAFLCALLLLGIMPLLTPPAEMITNATVSVNLTSSFVGETLYWRVFDEVGIGPYKYAFDVYKDGILVSEEPYYHWANYRFYTPTTPGIYYARAYVYDTGSVLYPYINWISKLTIVNPRVATTTNKIVKMEAVSGTALKITWNRIPGATQYELWRSASKLGTYKLVKALTGVTYSNTYLTPGTQYFYKVRYLTSAGWSSFSAPVVGVPLAKSILTRAAATGKDRVTLVWTKVPGANGYEVLMASSATGVFNRVKTTASNTLIVTGLQPDTGYYFKIRPYKKIGVAMYYGPYSGYRSARTFK